MELQETTLHSETIYDGKILHIRRDTVLLPNGREAIREVADHPGGVCVLALDQDNNALLVSQFRYPYRQVLRELPAGKLERGEDPDLAARRELREETGIEADALSPLYRVRSEEKHALYGGFLCVTDRPKDAVHLQAGETIAYRWLSREELVELVASSDFVPGLRGRLTPCLEGGTL